MEMAETQEQLKRLEEQWKIVLAEDERKHALISVRLRNPLQPKKLHLDETKS